MRKTTTLYLPKNGKEAWTEIMEGKATQLSEDVLEGNPIVMATAVFDDGFWVTGGVYKSDSPEEYNIKFIHVYTPDGQQIPFLIDPSDHEDFRQKSYIFYLNELEEEEYVVKIKERKKTWIFGE